MDVYERIKTRRKELNLSADDVAAALGVSRATVYRYESAEIEKLPTQIIAPLSRVLHCSPAYLMGWEDEMPAPAAVGFDLSPLECDLITRFRALPDGEKNFVLRSLGLPELSGREKDGSIAQNVG